MSSIDHLKETVSARQTFGSSWDIANAGRAQIPRTDNFLASSCPPIPGTLVVAIGQGLEAITSGVCASTTHRVLSPEAGKGARYSIPFFQGVSFGAKFENMAVPEEVKRLR